MYRRRSKYRSRSKRAYRNFTSAMGVAQQALAIANGVRGILNVEEKTYDTNQLNLSVSTTPHVALINDIDQGDGDNDRNGNQIKARQVYIKSELKRNTSASHNNVRVILLKDTEPTSTLPSATDLFDGATTYHVIAKKRYDNRKRFQFLHDRVYELGEKNTQVFEIFERMGLELNYSDGTGTNVTNCALYLVIISNDATNPPTVSYTCRLTYVDN